MRALWVALIFAVSNISIIQSQDFDSLIHELPNTSEAARIDLLHTLVVKTWLNYPEDAMSYAREAYELSMMQGRDQQKIAKSLRLIGGVYYYLGNYDSVLFYSNKSLKIASEIRDTVLINNALNNIGLAYYNMGSYQSALENLLRSLNLKQAINEVYGKALTLNNIGLVYDKLKDYKKAREYFNEGLDVAIVSNDSNLELYSLNNIGITFLKEGDLARAKSFFERSLRLGVDNKNWNAVTYSGLGRVYQQLGAFEKSRKYLDASLGLREEISEKNGISEIYYYYSKEAQRKGDYDSAIILLNKSQEIAEEIGSKERMFENFSLFSDLYQQKGDINKAYEYKTNLLKLRDTLFNEALAHNLSAIQLKIQEEENQKILEKKERQLIINRKINIFLIIIFGLALLLAILIFYAYRHNKRINTILAERNFEILSQKEEIEAQKEVLISKNAQLEKAHALITEQNEKLATYNVHLQDKVEKSTQELEDRNQQLKMANLELDNFLYKSSHDIKGPLATLMGICNVALLDIKNDKALKYFKMLLQTSSGLNDILTRLKTISDINSLELKYKMINFEELIEKCIRQVRNIEGTDDFMVTYEIDSALKCYSDPLLVDLIFFNMIQNAVRFKVPDRTSVSKIKITKGEGDWCVIHFLDNGIGIKDEDVNDIFQMFSKAALRHQTIGLGLYIVKQSAQKLGGDVMLQNDDKAYTHFRVTLPSS
ncbi:tetratricopeptide repeat-containing sensor histidine kinase [Fulvivirga ulvae]|uniref:tetratricopeptide repeat-containing sensor histidine kinase n=1 Tax=Fulvivirga ulvae TaxID=2904245 RepID=UPI001F358C03|nr:tetratricopeptide repeat-containing sensor histidine kinase [Fulvivirga ulvae]UII29939.1 tetratricopeptide repeat-containing sensor histidine kinase [Fulvivirga ulvae]